MNSRSTWAWVCISIVLVFGYWLTGKLKVEEQRAVFEKKKLFDFAAEDILRLSFSTREDALVEAARRSETEWSISAPYDHIVPNHGQWSRLAGVIPRLINERPIEVNPEDLALYGLADPPLRVEVEVAGTLIQLNIGNLDPTQNNRYAQLGADEVFLLPAQMANVLYQTLMNLRDTRVFPGIDSMIDRIHYKRFAIRDDTDALEGTEAIDEVYAQGDDALWRMTSPYEAYTFQNKVLHLISQLSFLTGQDYVDAPDDLGDFGLDPPWARIEVRNLETGVTQTLSLGWRDDMAEDGRMFASLVGNPSVFTIDAKMIGYLPDVPGDFREKHLFTQEAINLSAIHYRDSAHEFSLRYDEDSGWNLSEPAFDDIDQLITSNVIRFLKQIEGNRFPDSEEIQILAKEHIRYDFDFKDGTPSTSFAVGGPVPDSDPLMFYARQDIGPIITIPYEWVSLLQSKPFRFRQKTVFAYDPNLVTRLSVTLDGKRYGVENDAGTWRVTEPPEHGFESQADLVTLMRALPAFTAFDTVDLPPAPDLLGLDTPIFVADVETLSAEGERVSRHLEIGHLTTEASRLRYARVQGRPEIFLVDHGYIEDVRAGLKGIVSLPR